MESSKCHYRSSSIAYTRKLRNIYEVSPSSSPEKKFHKNLGKIRQEYPIKVLVGLLLLLMFSVTLFRSNFLSYEKCACDCALLPPERMQNVTVEQIKLHPESSQQCCSCESSSSEGNRSQKTFPSSSPPFADEKGMESETVLQNRAISPTIKTQLERSELIWKRSLHQRQAWISTVVGTSNNLSLVNPWDEKHYVLFWNYFPPSFNCPYSVQRVGFIGDGGKWVCGLELYEQDENVKSGGGGNKPCIIYSFGVANESSFEAEMLARTDCLVYAYDYSVKTIGFPVEPTNPRVTFKAVGIGNKNLGKFRTLKYLMEQNGHEWIDILKMDIEGGEYAALDKVMEDFTPPPHNHLPFGQLLLEVHVEGKIFPKFLRWWERLEARGLRAFHSEVNHAACAFSYAKPNFVEYSFLNIYGQHPLIPPQTITRV